MQTNRPTMHSLIGEEPCLTCDNHATCKEKQWACAAFFNYVGHGATAIKPVHPNSTWYRKLFNGVEHSHVGVREKGQSRRLNRTQVIEIRRMADERMGYRYIGELFNICPSMVGQILHRDIYKDIL